MEERRLVHRGASVFDGEQERAVLDHLLEEDAFDRLVVAAYVGRVEAVDREKRDDAGDRGDREEVADTVRVGTRGLRPVVRLHRSTAAAAGRRPRDPSFRSGWHHAGPALICELRRTTI